MLSNRFPFWTQHETAGLSMNSPSRQCLGVEFNAGSTPGVRQSLHLMRHSETRNQLLGRCSQDVSLERQSRIEFLLCGTPHPCVYVEAGNSDPSAVRLGDRISCNGGSDMESKLPNTTGKHRIARTPESNPLPRKRRNRNAGTPYAKIITT